MEDIMDDKSVCPMCDKEVSTLSKVNCYECMTCKQRMHSTCAFRWIEEMNKLRVPQQPRLASDDIVICPSCRQDKIARCSEPKVDVNAYLKGGKKYKKSRKNKKLRRLRKYKKSRKYRY